MYRDYLLPEVYKTQRPLHDDWAIRGVPLYLQPWTKIPRRYTFFGFSLPSIKLCGNAIKQPIEKQPGYPVAPLAREYEGDSNYFIGYHPVHPIGQWSIQLVYCDPLKRYCLPFFTMSKKIGNRRLHINAGFKPDVTKGDYGVWLEMSITFKRIS